METSSGGCLGCLGCLAAVASPVLLVWAIWSAISSAQERHRKEEAKEAERLARERQARIDAARSLLVALGDVVYVRQAGNRWVRCSNNHLYQLRDFWYESSYYSGMMCPMCKSPTLTFEGETRKRFRACDTCQCVWDTTGYNQCPSCKAANTP